MRSADVVCLLLVPGVLLLVHVVSCSGQGDVWSTERLEGQACRTSLLVMCVQRITPAVVTQLKDTTTVSHLEFLG